MKKTKKAWVFFILQMVCMIVIPCALIWLQYGGAELGTKYKISITAVLLLLLVFMIFKRVILNPFLKKIDGQLSQIEIQQLSVTDASAIQSNKKRYRTLALTQLVFNIIVPLILYILAVMTISVVQAQVIKLYGVMVFCGISIGVGILCRIGEIWALRCEHEK